VASLVAVAIEHRLFATPAAIAGVNPQA
jgi:hypothetical protein